MVYFSDLVPIRFDAILKTFTSKSGKMLFLETFSKFLKIIRVDFTDDLHDARNTITEQNRRLHEMEIELRRLENEREELSAAYKEAEAVSAAFLT